PPYPLAVHPSAVRAPQVAQQEQAIRLDDHAVHLRDALVIEPDVAILLAPHKRQILDDLEGRAPIKRHQLGAHYYSRLPPAGLRRAAPLTFPICSDYPTSPGGCNLPREKISS